MTEATLTLKIKKKLLQEGCYVEKTHGGRYQSGAPDLQGCAPWLKGRYFGFEVKLPGKEKNVTERQQAHLDRIAAAGGIASVISGWKQAYRLLGIEV